MLGSGKFSGSFIVLKYVLSGVYWCNVTVFISLPGDPPTYPFPPADTFIYWPVGILAAFVLLGPPNPFSSSGFKSKFVDVPSFSKLFCKGLTVWSRGILSK